MKHLFVSFNFLLLLSLLCFQTHHVQAAIDLDCDPCIDRSTFQLAALVPINAPDSVLKPLRQTALDMNIALETVFFANANDMAQILQQRSTNMARRPDAWIVTAPDDPSATTLENYVLNYPNPVPLFGWGWGYERLAPLTVGWITDDAWNSGTVAAAQVQALWNERADNTTLSAVAMIHSESGATLSGPNAVRWRAFLETMTAAEADTSPGRYTLIAVNDQDTRAEATLTDTLRNCPYQALLVSDPAWVPAVLAASALCRDETLVGVFLEDEDTANHAAVYQAMTRQHVAFALNPAVHLQVTLAVLMAAVYVTTGKALAMPIQSSTYWSGPKLLNVRNVPSDTAALCEQDAFPVCQSGVPASSSSSATNNRNNGQDVDSTPTTLSGKSCPCTARRQIRIGGVLHGDTSDAFWDPVFAAAQQAADDMHIDMDLERFQPQEPFSLIYEQMAARIRNLCDSGVDGLFVTIPDPIVEAAVQRCHDLRVPVVSVNSGLAASANLGLVHHIGQDEYSGGYGGAMRLIAAGMKRGYCVDHAFGNTALIERCQGFRDAIAAHGQGVTFGKHIDVPGDNEEQYVINVAEAVEADGGWEGVGLIGFGSDPFPSLLRVLEEHPGTLAGTFDTSELVFETIRDGKALFGIDQQPFLQGKMPVYLLSYMISTQQHLVNHVIQSGPSFLEEYPSAAKKQCETNFYEVCPERPEEDLNYIPDSLIAMGYALFSLLGAAGLIAVAWTYTYREKWVVKVSQPMFLDLVVLGCLISGLSIVFMGFQTSYRYDRDGLGEPLEGKNPEIGLVDAGCMCVPWLYGMGFVITFSALFAKIYRVKLIYQAGVRMQRKQVTLADVLPVMGIMFVVEIGILLSWQLVAPLKWTREVTGELDGYPTASVGSCDGGEVGWRFYLGLVVFHVLCLCYALVLCFQTKSINEEFAESSYLSLAVVMLFQVLVIAVPISALVRDNTDVFYFVRAAAVFLQNFTVLVLIFVPKMHRMHEDQREGNNRTTRATSLVRQPTARNSGNTRQLSGEFAARQSLGRRGLAVSWGGASLTEEGDEGNSRSLKASDEILSSIREEDEEGKSSSDNSSHPEKAPQSGLNSGSAHRLESRLLSPFEVENKWDELGFPSKEKAQMIMDLVKRSTEPGQRKVISTDLFASSRTGEEAPESPVIEPNEEFSAPEPSEQNASPKPEAVSPRAFNDQLRATLSEMEEDEEETFHDGTESHETEDKGETADTDTNYFT